MLFLSQFLLHAVPHTLSTRSDVAIRDIHTSVRMYAVFTYILFYVCVCGIMCPLIGKIYKEFALEWRNCSETVSVLFFARAEKCDIIK